LGGELVW